MEIAVVGGATLHIPNAGFGGLCLSADILDSRRE